MEDASSAPPKIEFDSHCMDLAMHPSEAVVAAAQIDGRVSVFRYALEANSKLTEFTHHTDSCRAVTFSADGSRVFTGSLDQSISMIDVATGQVATHLPQAHSAGISSITTLSEDLAVSGDDDGCIKVWDLRARSKVCQFKESEDFISDMLWVPQKNTLLATSGDGALSVFDMTVNKMDTVSDYMEEELLSMVLIKNGNKVVCGTQEGVLGVFTWGTWADVSDRIPGHPNSVETMVKVDEDTILTGSSDGLIRIMQVSPHKLIGVIGDHDEFPIERIVISHDKNLLASCSHDNTVQFWDISFLREDEGEDDENDMNGAAGGQAAEGDMQEDNEMCAPPAAKGKKEEEPSFFDDL